jgi:antitoxin HicB
MTRKFHVVLQPEKEGGFSAFVPALPGCASQGETEAEAIRNIKEAIELYVEGLVADRQPIPSDDVHFKEIEIAA